MRKIPWLIWVGVIIGWLGIGATEGPLGAIPWLLGVGILVYAYYQEKR